jgi:hypothetical protein
MTEIIMTAAQAVAIARHVPCCADLEICGRFHPVPERFHNTDTTIAFFPIRTAPSVVAEGAGEKEGYSYCGRRDRRSLQR